MAEYHKDQNIEELADLMEVIYASFYDDVTESGMKGEEYCMDEYNVVRFIEAQNVSGYGSYRQALSEIKAGRKESHWIWYIFPQHIGLGRSDMNEKYGIKCFAEAKAYYANDTLRSRLLEICTALYELDTDDPVAVFGIPDAYKMRSCCTLFQAVAPECEIFGKILDKYCQGEGCSRTIELLREEGLG